MTKYNKYYEDNFKKDLKKLRYNFDLQKRLRCKIDKILEDPYHYKTLRNVLKNRCRVHIGSFVLIFRVVEEKNLVVFEGLNHHDDAY
ncbi:MAG: type II toxin-antitoxin system RelE/ParE family toxin [Deltaproteobacteria bacterium]|nr:type II toxin-antitoxin system RelE/ParE family toxin [Deltaproteobacteria bacterium]